MKALIQRVSGAAVAVEGRAVGTIGRGYAVLLGVRKDDDAAHADRLAEKTTTLRLWPDAEGRMNRDLIEVGGSLLVVSQFTLYADARKGRRPRFDRAAPAPQAQGLYLRFVEACRRRLAAAGSPGRVATGVFGAHMELTITNDGPVTILIESHESGRLEG